MNDEISDEEHKRTKAIMRRYRWQNIATCLAFPIAYVILAILWYKLVGTKWNRQAIWIFILFHAFGTGILLDWTRRRFAKKLSLEERKLLVGIALRDSMSQYTSIQEILKEIVINPQKELLRPSEKKEDNTLLRAATQTDDTAQEQLLRPTQNDTA